MAGCAVCNYLVLPKKTCQAAHPKPITTKRQAPFDSVSVATTLTPSSQAHNVLQDYNSTMESDSDVHPIESLEQIPSTLRPELYALLLKANQAHGPERTEVAVDEINLFSRLVFEDQNRWDSSMLPSTPVHRPMEPGNDGVIGPIGRFLEVLPEPFNVQPKSGFLTIVVRRICPFWITSLSAEHSPTRHARSTALLSSRSNSTPPLVV